MVTEEREMVEKFPDPPKQQEERFTSLQPTYEDTLPDEDLDWDDDRTS